jgi:acetyl esterase/lipase
MKSKSFQLAACAVFLFIFPMTGHARFLDNARRDAKKEAEMKIKAKDSVLHADVVYKTVGDLELTLDILLPKNPARDRDGRVLFKKGHPCVLYFHGGGWRASSRYMSAADARQFTSRGLALACVSYRYATGGNTIETCVTDAFDAARFITSRAGDYGITPDFLLATGGSAGGMLSLMMNYADASAFPGDPGLRNVRVRFAGAAVRAPPPFLFDDLAKPGTGDYSVTLPEADNADAALAALDTGKFALNKKISPYFWLRAGAPHVVIIHGEKDTAVDIKYNFWLQQKARGLGASVTVWPVPGANHGLRGGLDCPLKPGVYPVLLATNLLEMARAAAAQPVADTGPDYQ